MQSHNAQEWNLACQQPKQSCSLEGGTSNTINTFEQKQCYVKKRMRYADEAQISIPPACRRYALTHVWCLTERLLGVGVSYRRFTVSRFRDKTPDTPAATLNVGHEFGERGASISGFTVSVRHPLQTFAGTTTASVATLNADTRIDLSKLNMQTFSQSFVRGTPVCAQAPCSRRIRQRAQRISATVATEPRTELKTAQSEKVRTPDTSTNAETCCDGRMNMMIFPHRFSRRLRQCCQEE